MNAASSSDPGRSGAVGALLFLARRSLRNRTLSLLGKLRQIPYLLAVLTALALFALWLVPYLVLRGQADVETTLVRASPWVLPLAALGLTALATYWWARGKYDRVLSFTPAETDLLVCGPIGRRTLVSYKLLRAQIGILMAVVWAGLFVGSGVSWPLRWAGFWLFFTTLHLHQIAGALVRTAVLQGRGGLRRSWVPLAVFGAVVAVLLWTAADALPPALAVARSGDFGGAARLLSAALEHPAAQAALFPARLVLAPIFATDGGTWLAALPGALVLLALHFVWVLRTDAAVEEGASAAGREQEKLRDTMVRHGLFSAMRRMWGSGRSRRVLFRLRSTGRPWVALTWKNLTMGLRSLSPSVLLWGLVGALPVLLMEAGSDGREILELLGSMLTGFAVLLLVMGPFVVRNDLRSDLHRAELLRTYPLRGRTLVGAETAASVVSLTVAQYLLVVPSALLLAPTLGAERHVAVLAASAAAVLFLPLVNALLILLQNGMALFLPAWMPIGRERTGGIDQLGRTTLTWLGTFVLMIPAVLPTLLVAGGVSFALWSLAGGRGAVLVGAAVAWGLLAAEVVLLVHLLGDQWDEMDVVEAGLLR